jgi:branched-chain amino acid transport system permease protein
MIAIQTIVNAVSLGALYALVALGIALVFGVLGLINFAYGELVMIAGYTAAMLDHQPVPVIIVGTVAAATVAALLMERLAFRPVRGASPATLLITSFAVSYLLQNVATAIWTSTARPVVLPSFVAQTLTVHGIFIGKLTIVILVVAGAALISVAYFLRRTPIGLQMRAASEDFLMARLLGVRADAVIATAFAVTGVIAGIVGLAVVAQAGVITPTSGVSLTLIGFVATVVGGMGSVPAAASGGFLLGAATIVLDTYLPVGVEPYRDALIYSGVIAILLLWPEGLLVRRSPVAL